MKNDYDISKQFQDDLIRAYKEVAPGCWSQFEAYEKAVKQPAPRYYISAKHAAQVISPMTRGNFTRVDMMMPNKRRMYYSLFEKVIELSEKKAFIGKSLTYIVQYAVSSPAPEFFVTKYAVEQVRRYIKNGYLDDDGKVVNYKSRDRLYEKLKAKRQARKKASVLGGFPAKT